LVKDDKNDESDLMIESTFENGRSKQFEQKRSIDLRSLTQFGRLNFGVGENDVLISRLKAVVMEFISTVGDSTGDSK
jgi:hypothetical protein